MILVAAASGQATNGAGVMLSFGAGTLPVMLGLTLGGANLSRILTIKPMRHVAAVTTLLAALWTISLTFPRSSESLLVAHHLLH